MHKLQRRISTHQKQLWQIFLLGLVIALAAFLRLYRIESLMRFIWDEGRDMLAIRQIIVNRDLTLFGPFNEIDGRIDFFGVFHYYLMLPALWIANFNPVGPAIFTALLGTAAVGLVYFWVRDWESHQVALAVSLLYAVSPLVAEFSRWPWNPNTIGFFAILYLIVLQKYQNMRSWWLVGVAGLLLGLLFQLHYFTLPLVAAFGVIWWKHQPKRWWDLGLFGLGFVLPNLTFVVFDVTHQGFYRSILLESFFGQSSQRLVEYSLSNIFLGPAQYLLTVSSDFMGSIWLGSIMVVILTYMTGRELMIFAKQRPVLVPATVQLSLVWIVFLAMTSVFPSLLDNYHSAGGWFLLPVVLVVFLKKFWPRLWLPVIGVLVIWLVWSNQLWQPPSWQQNMPLVRTAAWEVAADARNFDDKKVAIASFVDPDTRATRFRYFLAVKNQPVLHHDQYPETEILYVVSEENWEIVKKNPAWELDGYRQAKATKVWQDQGWKVYRVEK